MIIVGAVILPFCFGLAFKPVAVALAALLFKFHFFNPSKTRAAHELPLFNDVVNIVKARVGEVPVVLPGVRQLIVGTRNRELERRLNRAMLESTFRAHSLLPGALVVGGLLYRASPPPVDMLAFPVAIAVYIVGVRSSNFGAYNNQVLLNVAVILSERGYKEAEGGGAS